MPYPNADTQSSKDSSPISILSTSRLEWAESTLLNPFTIKIDSDGRRSEGESSRRGREREAHLSYRGVGG